MHRITMTLGIQMTDESNELQGQGQSAQIIKLFPFYTFSIQVKSELHTVNGHLRLRDIF